MTDEMKSLILGIHEEVETLRKGLMEVAVFQDLLKGEVHKEIEIFQKKYSKADEDVWLFLKKVNNLEQIVKEALKSFGSWFFLNDGEIMKKSKTLQEICYRLNHKIGREPIIKQTDASESLMHAVERMLKRLDEGEGVKVKLKDLELWEYLLNRIPFSNKRTDKILKGIGNYIAKHRSIQTKLSGGST